MIEVAENKCILTKAIEWEQLVKRLHFLDIKILENLYLPEPTATYFKALERKFDRVNVKRTAIRNHIKKLEDLGLLETLKSGILLVNSIPQIAENVRMLIIHSKLRWGEKC